MGKTLMATVDDIHRGTVVCKIKVYEDFGVKIGANSNKSAKNVWVLVRWVAFDSKATFRWGNGELGSCVVRTTAPQLKELTPQSSTVWVMQISAFPSTGSDQ